MTENNTAADARSYRLDNIDMLRGLVVVIMALNLAVMRAWQAGIVVVTSAGNTGPEPMTIGVPANVPYVITVGAVTDAHTPDDTTDDYLASFSAAGPGSCTPGLT